VTAIGDVVQFLGGSLLQGVSGAISDPVAGWIDALLGLGESAGDNGLSSSLQTDTTTILTAISNLGPQLEQFDAAESAFQSMQDAVSTATGYQNNMQSGLMVVPSDLATDNIKSGYLDVIHTWLVAPTPGDPQQGQPGAQGLLPVCIDQLFPRFVNDQSRGVQSFINNYLAYYTQIQTILLQMMVNACHAGQFYGEKPVQASIPNPPPNYFGAQAYFNRYQRHIAQQSTYIPYTTTGHGYQGTFPGAYGCKDIVLDKSMPTQSGWGSQNLRSLYGPLSMRQILGLLAYPTVTDQWMLRWPTLDELKGLGFPTATNPITVNGFNLQLVAANDDLPAPVCNPFPSAEAFDFNNTDIWLPTGVANSYSCDYFWDLYQNAQATVTLMFPDYGIDKYGSLAGVAANCDPLDVQIDSNGYHSYIGDGKSTFTVYDYCDGIFIYQLTLGDQVTNVQTTPPLEEPDPSSFAIVVPQSSNPMTFQARAKFKRLNKTAGGPTTPRYQEQPLSVPLVCRLVDDESVATIDPNSGVLTWNKTGTVNVYAIRGPLSVSASVSSPAGFTAPAPPAPTAFNIYPRIIVLNQNDEDQAIDVNAQLVYPDGTSDPSDIGATPSNTGCTFQSDGLKLVAGEPSRFNVPGGTTGNFTISLIYDSKTVDTANVSIRAV